jgi:hypothetical protein
MQQQAFLAVLLHLLSLPARSDRLTGGRRHTPGRVSSGAQLAARPRCGGAWRFLGANIRIRDVPRPGSRGTQILFGRGAFRVFKSVPLFQDCGRQVAHPPQGGSPPLTGLRAGPEGHPPAPLAGRVDVISGPAWCFHHRCYEPVTSKGAITQVCPETKSSQSVVSAWVYFPLNGPRMPMPVVAGMAVLEWSEAGLSWALVLWRTVTTRVEPEVLVTRM